MSISAIIDDNCVSSVIGSLEPLVKEKKLRACSRWKNLGEESVPTVECSAFSHFSGRFKVPESIQDAGRAGRAGRVHPCCP